MSQAIAPQKDKPELSNLPPIEQISAITQNIPVTPERRKLLAVLSLPQSAIMSISDICRYAGIDRQTYYNAKQDSTFNDLQIKLSRSLIKGNALKYYHNYDKMAEKGNYKVTERLLEQNGTLDPKETVVNVNRTDALASCKDKTMAGIEAFGEPVEAEYTIESEGIDEEMELDNRRADNRRSENGDANDPINGVGCKASTDGPTMPDTNSDREQERY